MYIMRLLTISWSEPGTIVAIFVAGLAALVLIGKILRWTGITDTKIDFLTGEVKDIKTSIKDITTSIGDISTNIRQNEVSASNSPAQLNEHGIKISDGINGKEFVKKHLNAINYNNEMNEYQLQQACFDYAQSELIGKISDEERKALETVAYNQGVSIQTVLTVLGFDLRNAKFKELGIDTAVIDKHKP